VKVVPIQPPGDVDACVKRFVAGEPDDRLDAVMVVSLPPESFQSTRDKGEARFTGAYEIWTLNLRRWRKIGIDLRSAIANR